MAGSATRPALRNRGGPRLLASALSLALAGCGGGGGFADISFSPAVGSPYLVNLAYDASRRNPYAQMELGMLYETGGRGLPRSLLCAARLYEAAATGPIPHPEAEAKLNQVRGVIDSASGERRPSCDDVAQQTASWLEYRHLWAKPPNEVEQKAAK